ncbi:Na+/H+ antiporter NhaC family protein [Vibrio sp. S4M6]|uniref:Na+/H+ antiporter NhaC family protein n=1 Tax=Vibrio sinus TaxID=2946865 RepID=UPI002029F394|nr:Na+/H+ antiporter NhaC family protein [Vibrio sinus]MCL9782346.1 Na+/H+ antiporter NhaC family protein [Vibrio sinus]
MNLIDFSSSPISLLPAVVALSLAIVTRHVIASLGVGILLGAFLLADHSIYESTQYLGATLFGVFIEDGGLNTWNMSILGFLILLGMMTALLALSGGTAAFANWAQHKVKSKRGSKLLAAVLGVFIFIDDYFNSLAVGSISRPVTDRFYVSRAKLAYILDSTAAPMCVISPVSSWGAYIMTIVSGILISHGIVEYSALGAYLRLIPMNFYAIFALLMVFVVAWFSLDIGPMRKHEIKASQAQCIDEDENHPSQDEELGIKESPNGKVVYLIAPIVILIISTFSAMLVTGLQSLEAQNKAYSLFAALENTNVGTSLIIGSAIGVLSSLIIVLKQKLPTKDIGFALWVGAKSMKGAIIILIFAWTIGKVIGDMQTGSYLSTLAQGNVSPAWLPVILFLLSGLMAFSTGTSWGTFGIMLPIAGDMAASIEISLMLPMLSAVLAGSVFGDHCSPISDTTILSSTGAKCNHIAHVSTQLPYALAVAFISSIGFIVLGQTESLALSLLITTIAFVIVCVVFSVMSRSRMSTSSERHV